MSTPPTTVLDRYVGLADRVVTDPAILETELANILAPDATVDITGTPVTGFPAILGFYRRFITMFAESRHLWQTTVDPDGTLRAEWAASFRTPDGRLGVVAGVETAELDEGGLIVSLVNTYTVPPSVRR
ncbi:ethyl tert-butyl ether degradation protein EthD [Streptomyces sp. NPDC046870]|uniref:ethyl tert-butyl ether degradation protein EthD n=1 Tax=Streptomyces sp. NPDC046870 TaxID=3155135 RepID=UPI003451B97E